MFNKDTIIYDREGNVLKFEDIDMKKGMLDYFDYENNTCIYCEFDPKEVERLENAKKIIELKQKLSETDYKALKYAEGFYTEEEYKPIKEYREAIREQIRLIEDIEKEC